MTQEQQTCTADPLQSDEKMYYINYTDQDYIIGQKKPWKGLSTCVEHYSK
jgi:hypothetical protein